MAAPVQPQPKTPPIPRDAFAAIRVAPFRRYILGRAAASFGIQFTGLSVFWLTYELTHSSLALGLLGICLLLPSLGLTIPAGNIADRLPRKTVAMWAYALQAGAAGGMAIASWLHAPIFAIYALLVAFGTASAFTFPALSGVVPQLVQTEQLADANAWFSATSNIANISGPALGGLLIAQQKSATLILGIASLTFLILIVVLATLPLRPVASKGQRSLAEIFAGLDFIRRNAVYNAILWLDLFATLLAGANALIPVYAKDLLHAGPTGLGWLRAAIPFGALVAAVLAIRLPPWQRPGRVLIFSVAAYGLATIGFGLSQSLPVAMLFLALTGAFDAFGLMIQMTLGQAVTPDALRGRVASVVALCVNVADHLGRFESGLTAAAWGPVVSVVTGGLGAVIIAVLIALLRPELARLGPLHTLQPEPEPKPRRETPASS